MNALKTRKNCVWVEELPNERGNHFCNHLACFYYSNILMAILIISTRDHLGTVGSDIYFRFFLHDDFEPTLQKNSFSAALGRTLYICTLLFHLRICWMYGCIGGENHCLKPHKNVIEVGPSMWDMSSLKYLRAPNKIEFI